MHEGKYQSNYSNSQEARKCKFYCHIPGYLSPIRVSLAGSGTSVILPRLQVSRCMSSLHPSQDYSLQNYSQTKVRYCLDVRCRASWFSKDQGCLGIRSVVQDSPSNIINQRKNCQTSKLQKTTISKWSLYETD